MAKFTYTMNDSDAIKAVKKAVIGIPCAILKENSSNLTVGSPMMTVKIKIKNGEVETKASLFGRTLLGSIDTAIEFIDGFTKK